MSWFVVAMLGCYYGLRCGRRHGAVGDAVRAGVVGSVVWVVIADTVRGFNFLAFHPRSTIGPAILAAAA